MDYLDLKMDHLINKYIDDDIFKINCQLEYLKKEGIENE